MQIIYLDTETTGFGKSDKILQIATMVHGDDCKTAIINTDGRESKPESIEIHGITNEMMEGQPLFSEYAEEMDLQSLFDAGILVIHNADFDTRMLRQEGMDIPRYICTQKIAKDVVTDSKNHKLQTLREHFSINIEAKAHDAGGDVAVLKEVFVKLIPLLKEKYSLKDKQSIINKMLQISKSKHLLGVIPVDGPYKGQTFTYVEKNDPGYLQALLSDMEKTIQVENPLLLTLKKHVK